MGCTYFVRQKVKTLLRPKLKAKRSVRSVGEHKLGGAYHWYKSYSFFEFLIKLHLVRLTNKLNLGLTGASEQRSLMMRPNQDIYRDFTWSRPHCKLLILKDLPA